MVFFLRGHSVVRSGGLWQRWVGFDGVWVGICYGFEFRMSFLSFVFGFIGFFLFGFYFDFFFFFGGWGCGGHLLDLDFAKGLI